MHGDGSAIWVACHVDDVAHAFVQALGNSRAYGQAYHITGEEWMTWNRYYQMAAAAIAAPPPRLVHIPTDLLMAAVPQHASLCAENFQGNNIFDNAAARRDLDFRYTITWTSGVRRVAAWLDDHGGVDSCDDDPLDDHLVAAWERLSERLQHEMQA